MGNLNRIVLGLVAVVGSASSARAESWATPSEEFQYVVQPSASSASVEPTATEMIDQLFLGAIESLCSDSSSDAACVEVLDGYQNSYEVAAVYAPEPFSPLEPRGEPEDNRVDALEVAVGAYISYVKDGSLGQPAIDGLNKGMLELLKLAAEGTKKAEDLILKFASEEKAIVLASLKAGVVTLEAELKKATDEKVKKSLQAQIDLAKRLIAGIEKGVAKKE